MTDYASLLIKIFIWLIFTAILTAGLIIFYYKVKGYIQQAKKETELMKKND